MSAERRLEARLQIVQASVDTATRLAKRHATLWFEEIIRAEEARQELDKLERELEKV